MVDTRLVRPERRTGTRYIHCRDDKVEHRMIMEELLGRQLRPGELVHHVNGDVRDNAPANLRLTTRHEHVRIHRQKDMRLKPIGGVNPTVPCQCGCGGHLQKYDARNRPRDFISGHNQGGRHWKWSKK